MIPPWLIHLLGGFIFEAFNKSKQTKLRQQLASDLKDVDKMDIPNPEKRAIRKGLIDRYQDESD